jgi:hypothetical protein
VSDGGIGNVAEGDSGSNGQSSVRKSSRKQRYCAFISSIYTLRKPPARSLPKGNIMRNFLMKQNSLSEKLQQNRAWSEDNVSFSDDPRSPKTRKTNIRAGQLLFMTQAFHYPQHFDIQHEIYGIMRLLQNPKQTVLL